MHSVQSTCPNFRHTECTHCGGMPALFSLLSAGIYRMTSAPAALWPSRLAEHFFVVGPHANGDAELPTLPAAPVLPSGQASSDGSALSASHAWEKLASSFVYQPATFDVDSPYQYPIVDICVVRRGAQFPQAALQHCLLCTGIPITRGGSAGGLFGNREDSYWS